LAASWTPAPAGAQLQSRENDVVHTQPDAALIGWTGKGVPNPDIKKGIFELIRPPSQKSLITVKA